jgi:hypothetical protein
MSQRGAKQEKRIVHVAQKNPACAQSQPENKQATSRKKKKQARIHDQVHAGIRT